VSLRVHRRESAPPATFVEISGTAMVMQRGGQFRQALVNILRP